MNREEFGFRSRALDAGLLERGTQTIFHESIMRFLRFPDVKHSPSAGGLTGAVKDHARLWFRGKIKNIRDFVASIQY